MWIHYILLIHFLLRMFPWCTVCGYYQQCCHEYLWTCSILILWFFPGWGNSTREYQLAFFSSLVNTIELLLFFAILVIIESILLLCWTSCHKEPNMLSCSSFSFLLKGSGIFCFLFLSLFYTDTCTFFIFSRTVICLKMWTYIFPVFSYIFPLPLGVNRIFEILKYIQIFCIMVGTFELSRSFSILKGHNRKYSYTIFKMYLLYMPLVSLRVMLEMVWNCYPI